MLGPPLPPSDWVPSPEEEALAKAAYRVGWEAQISPEEAADSGGIGVSDWLILVIIHGGFVAAAATIAWAGIGPVAALVAGAAVLCVLALAWLGIRRGSPFPPAPPDDWPWARWQPAARRRYRAWRVGRWIASATFLLEVAILAIVGAWAEMG